MNRRHMLYLLGGATALPVVVRLPRASWEDLFWARRAAEVTHASVLVARDGRAFAMNAACAYLWSLSDGSRSGAELARALADYGGITLERARGDVHTFLRGTTRIGLMSFSAEKTARPDAVSRAC